MSPAQDTTKTNLLRPDTMTTMLRIAYCTVSINLSHIFERVNTLQGVLRQRQQKQIFWGRLLWPCRIAHCAYQSLNKSFEDGYYDIVRTAYCAYSGPQSSNNPGWCGVECVAGSSLNLLRKTTKKEFYQTTRKTVFLLPLASIPPNLRPWSLLSRKSFQWLPLPCFL